MMKGLALLKNSSIAMVALLCSSGAFAHHSGAMFDQEHKITVSGTVRVFQWTNPHCYIQLLVPDKKGNQEEWSLEMAAPIYLQQRGWRPVSVKPGDKLTVTLSPLRNLGKHKGGLVTVVIDAMGKPIGKPAGNTP